MAAKVFYSHGKLLLTAEYLVLDGAKALAVPTNSGQYLTVKPIEAPELVWESYDDAGLVWYEDKFLLESIENCKNYQQESKVLVKILLAAQGLNPSFLRAGNGFRVTTRLTFNRRFGLGSSSTLIANIAKWADVNPYALLFASFPGSGYDIACANHVNSALVYQVLNNKPKVNSIVFTPKFKTQLYFVYLNKKQSSREGITHYKTVATAVKKDAIGKANCLTEAMLNCNELEVFEGLLEAHETLISEVIQMQSIKESLFADYAGSVKSLGAWGGDFVLVTAKEKSDLDYFRKKGYATIVSFNDMVLH